MSAGAGGTHVTPDEFQDRVLAAPLAAIHVLNALDCRRLGLMSAETTASYLDKVGEELEGLSTAPSSAETEDALREAWDAWHEDCAEQDARTSVDVRNYASVGTVVAFGAFVYAYASVFASAQKYFEQSGLSKLAGLIGQGNLHRRIAEPGGISEAEVDDCIRAIQAAASSGKVPLVKHVVGKVWVAPKADGALTDATGYRDRLGMVHLPRDGETRPESATLMRIEFDSNELASRVELKRPCVFDAPGHRFRALAGLECSAVCALPRPHGYTVNLGTAGFPDGQEELTYHATPSSHFLGWSVSQLGGRLAGLHPDTEKHKDFAVHLLSRDAQPSSAGAFRRTPWGLASELKSLFADAGGNKGGDHGDGS